MKKVIKKTKVVKKATVKGKKAAAKKPSTPVKKATNAVQPRTPSKRVKQQPKKLIDTPDATPVKATRQSRSPQKKAVPVKTVQTVPIALKSKAIKKTRVFKNVRPVG